MKLFCVFLPNVKLIITHVVDFQTFFEIKKSVNNFMINYAHYVINYCFLCNMDYLVKY